MSGIYHWFSKFWLSQHPCRHVIRIWVLGNCFILFDRCGILCSCEYHLEPSLPVHKQSKLEMPAGKVASCSHQFSPEHLCYGVPDPRDFTLALFPCHILPGLHALVSHHSTPSPAHTDSHPHHSTLSPFGEHSREHPTLLS